MLNSLPKHVTKRRATDQKKEQEKKDDMPKSKQK